MLAASALFAGMAVLVKLMPRIPTQEIVLVRSALNVAFTLALIRRYAVSAVGRRPATLFLRGIFGYASLSFHFYALASLPLADAVLLHNVSPFVVALLAPRVLGERGGPHTLALSAIGLLGVALVVRPTGQLSLLPGLAALAGAVMSAGAYLTIRGIGATEHPLTVVLYFPMVSVLLSAVPAARSFVAPDALETALLLGVGLTTTAAQICLTAALQRERAAVATTVSYTSLVFAGALGALVFGEVPGPRTLAGAAAIVGAALLISGAKSDRAPEDVGPAR